MRRWAVMALVLAGCATATPPYASVVNNPAAHAPNMAYVPVQESPAILRRSGDTTPFVIDTGVIILEHRGCGEDPCPVPAAVSVVVESN